jgi:formate dehydrogenase accessory protein FdhE
MRESWARRIERAEQLAAGGGPSANLLSAYAEILRFQKDLYDLVTSDAGSRLSAALDRNLDVLRAPVAALLEVMARNGPEPLAEEATELLDGPTSRIDDLLLTWWRTPSDRQFFAKASLQPYAEWLVETRRIPEGHAAASGASRCPHCGGAPQLSILQAAAGAASDGGGRSLLCATCLAVWPFRRVVCAHCGEEDERKLGYYQTASHDHLRVDACDSCGHYLKSVDLTRLGIAVPIVDEVYGAPLDIWARERGYRKIELNLLGL